MGLFARKRKSENIIFDLLNIDIKSFDTEDYEFIGIEENSENTEFKRYRKKLKSLELGLFNVMDAFIYSENEASYFFYCNSKDANFKKLKKLINKFYKAFGTDALSNGEFSDSEITAILNGKYWTGRMWTKAKPEIMFTLIKDGIIELGILGVEINK
ncbi:MAG: hypothetical protein RBR97_20400 [Bacteroidales bacterium]|nr:hypothetical protein [Bacteroidales bacterium]